MADRPRPVLAALVTLLAGVAACSIGTPASESPSTLVPATTETPEPVPEAVTLATTEDGYLLPPGIEELVTAAPPEVTVFDDRSSCDTTAPDLDVLRMQTMVAAYNTRDAETLLAVLQTNVHDFSAIPHLGSASTDDPLIWAEAGWAVSDRLQLVMVRTYSGSGADGLLQRSNDLLNQAGIGSLTYGFKVQARGCVITRFVGSAPSTDACDWYLAFSEQIRAADADVWVHRTSACQDA